MPRLLPLAIVAALLAAAPAVAADYPAGTESFAVFGDPVAADQPPWTCAHPETWDGPFSDPSCMAPMKGNSRAVDLGNGQTAWIAPIGRWVCVDWARLSVCRTIEEAREGRLVLQDSTPYDQPFATTNVHQYVFQLVPNWVASIRVGKTTIPAHDNVAFGEVPTSAVPYMQRSDHGFRSFAPRVPKAARRFRIFRLPLGRPRSLTAQEQARVAVWFGNASFEPLPQLARRFGASDWVGVPGRKGFGLYDLAGSDPDLPPELHGIGIGTSYAGSEDGFGPLGGHSCAVPVPATEPCPDEVFGFEQLVPDYVRWADVAGERYVPVDGLIYGSTHAYVGKVFGDLVANLRRWKAKQRRTKR